MPFDHFNAAAGIYARAGESEPDKQFLELLDLQAGMSLLDAGGGTGRVSGALRGKARQIVIADPSNGMLRVAINKGMEGVLSSGEQLPFATAQFERVLMVDAFHHVADQAQTAAELWRVLKPGGRLLMIEPNIHRLEVKLLAVMEKVMLMRSHISSPETIQALFVRMGARVSLYKNASQVRLLVEKK